MLRAAGLAVFAVFFNLSPAAGQSNDTQPASAAKPTAGRKAKAETQRKPSERHGPILATGRAQPGLESFDRMMARFMARHDPPGAAIAVARHGKLVYARGFGYADIATHEPVQPTSLFRIASISKPVTAAAVLQLVERGSLSLDDRMVEVLHLEPRGPHPDARLRDVTIRHLLHHAGGWDRDEAFDPMVRPFRVARAMNVPLPPGTDTIIPFMMSQPLQFQPGHESVYSNFGYCLLGRVIEKVSGQPYETYVQAHVLRPLGIRDMAIGRSLEPERLPGEVKYYDSGNSTGRGAVGDAVGKTVPEPYGAWYLEAMDSHGGWVASAVDLLRFATAFDDPEHCPILKASTIRTMFARPDYLKEGDGSPQAAQAARRQGDPERDYACGWEVVRFGPDRITTFHLGLLDGTSTLLVRRFDGIDWAILFNSDMTLAGKQFAATIDPLVHRAADAVTSWPDIDLFPQYFGADPGTRAAAGAPPNNGVEPPVGCR